MSKKCTLNQQESTRLLKANVQRLRGHVDAARTQDADGIHDLRVASRRLRIALTEQASSLGKAERDEFSSQVACITRLLGKARELDVSIALLVRLCEGDSGIQPEASALIEQRLRGLREAESTRVQEAAGVIDGPSFNTRLIALMETTRPAKGCYRKRAQARLSRRHKRLCKLYAKWREDPSDGETLHRIRVQLKKLRYACEVYAPLYGEAMDGFLKRMKSTQEALGEWNDARMLREHIRQAVQGVNGDSGEASHTTVASSVDLLGLIARVDAEVGTMLDAFKEASKGFFSSDHKEEIKALFGRFHRGCCPKDASES